MPYFDHNATTPLATVARETWLRAQDEAWQNPSSPYRAAAHVKIRLDAAREKFAILLGDAAERYVFTSGATEAANLVIGWWAQTLPADALIAVNPTEHPCVLEPLKRHFEGRIRWLKLNPQGVIDLMDLKVCHLLSDKRDRVAAVVVMAANNETGGVQPWNEIAAACADAGAGYLCDASQWLGKLPAGGLSLLPDISLVVRRAWGYSSSHRKAKGCADNSAAGRNAGIVAARRIFRRSRRWGRHWRKRNRRKFFWRRNDWGGATSLSVRSRRQCRACAWSRPERTGCGTPCRC
jgi:hypothetical protein